MTSNQPQDFGQPLVLEDFILVEQPVITSSTPLCSVCHAAVDQSRRCSGCSNITYCSKACQVNDWDQHKLVCKHFARSTSPGPAYRRALWFEPTQSRPKFVWLKYSTDGTPLDIAAAFAITPKADIKTIAFHDRFLPYWIQLSYDSNPNRPRTMYDNPHVGHAFRGPVMAIAYDAEEGLSQPALDVDTATLRPVRAYAKLRAEYDGPIFVEQPQKRYTEEEWKVIMKSVMGGKIDI